MTFPPYYFERLAQLQFQPKWRCIDPHKKPKKYQAKVSRSQYITAAVALVAQRSSLLTSNLSTAVLWIECVLLIFWFWNAHFMLGIDLSVPFVLNQLLWPSAHILILFITLWCWFHPKIFFFYKTKKIRDASTIVYNIPELILQICRAANHITVLLVYKLKY